MQLYIAYLLLSFIKTDRNVHGHLMSVKDMAKVARFAFKLVRVPVKLALMAYGII